MANKHISSNIKPFYVKPDDITNIIRRYNKEEIMDESESSELARYYEKSITEMNVNKIRRMPSKEICKVTNPDIKNNMSPINAMMI